MSSQMSLKEAERRAFRSTFQDGIWDIYLGLVFLMFGIGPFIQVREEYDWIVTVGYFSLIVILFIAAKKYITTPRIGRATFSTARKKKVNKVRLVLFLSVILGAVVYFLSADGSVIEGSIAAMPIPILLFTLNIFLVFGFGAYFLDFTRLYAYGALLGLSFPVGHFLVEIGVLASATRPFLLSSAIMIVIGIVLFVRFLRDNPPFDENSLPAGGA